MRLDNPLIAFASKKGGFAYQGIADALQAYQQALETGQADVL